MRIYKLTENDFDEIVLKARGKRLTNDDSREDQPNADYLFEDSVVELKFIEEEGLEKKQRRQKIAEIFKERFPNKPVVVLSTANLEDDKKLKYYQLLSTPIKTHIKKAAEQLKQADNNYPNKTRVAILINTGYGSLYHEEFKEIAIKRATNDTQQIDSLVVGGIYFYSDGFDSYVLCPFDEIPINLNKRFTSFDKLNKEWGAFMNSFMTSVIRNDRDIQPDRLPVLEINFEVDDVKYVKPAPPIGVPSKFWANGRPRKNSTDIMTCPPVGIIFPKLDKANWKRFRERDTYDTAFRETYTKWLKFSADSTEKNEDVLKPFVNMEVSYDGFCEKYTEDEICFARLCEHATEVFQDKITKVINSAVSQTEFHLILPQYILLVVEEIGQDKVNDLSSIYHVKQSLGGEAVTPILENQKLFFEYGLCLASSYAIKYDMGQVIYSRDQKYMWQ